jgi:hypothetical protein
MNQSHYANFTYTKQKEYATLFQENQFSENICSDKIQLYFPIGANWTREYMLNLIHHSLDIALLGILQIYIRVIYYSTGAIWAQRHT